MRNQRLAVGIALVIIAVGSLTFTGLGLHRGPLQDETYPEGTYHVTRVPQAEVLEEMNSSSTETVVVLQWRAINETRDPTLLGTLLKRASVNETARIETTSEQTRAITQTLDPFLPAGDDVSVVLFVEYEGMIYRITGGLEI